MKFYQPEQCHNVAIYILVLLVGIGLVLTFQMSVLAQDVKTLAKEADKAVSASQRAMFSRKFEEAQKELEKAADLIEQIKAADPDFAQLKTLESKYAKQQKDLEKRLPKEKPAEPTPQPSEKDAAQDLNALAKEVNTALSASQRAMFSRKFEEAQEELKKAAELIGQIKAADPAFNQLKSLEGKYDRQKTDLEKRLPKEKPVESATGTQPDQPESQTDKLPSKVTYYLENVDRIMEQGENSLARDSVASPDDRIQGFEMKLKEANDVMKRIFDSYGDQFDHDHPDVKARQEKIAAFQSKIEEFKANVAAEQAQAAEVEAQRNAQSNEWLDKIKPYTTGLGQPGYDENKHLGSGTDNVDELVQQKAIYMEAKALFDEYQQVEFPHGKTEELELAEKDLVRALKGFEEGYQETLERFARRISEPLDRAEQWLTDQEAKAQSEGEKKPVYLHRNVIQEITNGILALDVATAGEDSRLQAFNERLANIEKRAEKLRKLGVERTVMIPDKFKGQEIDTLKTKAAEFLHKEYSDANVLRTTIISDDWTEERVWEYTDTTKTAVRYRITQSVTAQIAGKRGNEVFLYTIHIARDQRSDGSWGELYGHVMFIDPMLEENVNK